MLRRLAITASIVGIASSIIFAEKPEVLLEKANKLYIDGKYDEAISDYEAIIGQGFQSTQLYYNLGNAYFKQKNIPASILNFERAHLLSPSDDDINFNLELAKTYTVDKVEALPEFFLVSFVRGIKSWFSSNSWAYIAIFSFISVLVLLIIFWFSGGFGIKKLAFSLSVFLTLIFIISLSFSISIKNQIMNRNQAIIFAPAVSAKSSPGDSGKDLFILHAGTKVELDRTVGDWVEIKMADGNKGWVLKSTFERI